MSTGRWWNDTNRGGPKFWEINMSQCHSAHHKSHLHCPETEPGPVRSEASLNYGKTTQRACVCMHTCLMVQCHSYNNKYYWFFPPLWRFDPIPGHGLPLRGFAITLRRTTFGSSPLDKWSARRRDLYLATHDTHKRQEIHAPPAEFEPATPACERPQTHTP